MNAESSIPVPGRFRLLLHLFARPRTPTELASLESKHLSNVCRMLRELKTMGLVEATSSGSRERYYSMTRDGYMIYSLISRQAK